MVNAHLPLKMSLFSTTLWYFYTPGTNYIGGIYFLPFLLLCFLFVCLFANFSFIKVISATTWVRILKFGTKLHRDELYCVTKKQPQISYQSLWLFSFFLSNGNFCHRFLSSYWSQRFKNWCTPSGRQSVLCKWKLRCLSSFCLLFHFFLLSL